MATINTTGVRGAGAGRVFNIIGAAAGGQIEVVYDVHDFILLLSLGLGPVSLSLAVGVFAEAPLLPLLQLLVKRWRALLEFVLVTGWWVVGSVNAAKLSAASEGPRGCHIGFLRSCLSDGGPSCRSVVGVHRREVRVVVVVRGRRHLVGVAYAGVVLAYAWWIVGRMGLVSLAVLQARCV